VVALAFFIFTAFRTHGAQKTIYEHASLLRRPRSSMLHAFIFTVFSGAREVCSSHRLSLRRLYSFDFGP
jgi:hypothetical protein